MFYLSFCRVEFLSVNRSVNVHICLAIILSIWICLSIHLSGVSIWLYASLDPLCVWSDCLCTFNCHGAQTQTVGRRRECPFCLMDERSFPLFSPSEPSLPLHLLLAQRSALHSRNAGISSSVFHIFSSAELKSPPIGSFIHRDKRQSIFGPCNSSNRRPHTHAQTHTHGQLHANIHLYVPKDVQLKHVTPAEETILLAEVDVGWTYRRFIVASEAHFLETAGNVMVRCLGRTWQSSHRRTIVKSAEKSANNMLQSQ